MVFTKTLARRGAAGRYHLQRSHLDASACESRRPLSDGRRARSRWSRSGKSITTATITPPNSPANRASRISTSCSRSPNTAAAKMSTSSRFTVPAARPERPSASRKSAAKRPPPIQNHPNQEKLEARADLGDPILQRHSEYDHRRRKSPFRTLLAARLLPRTCLACIVHLLAITIANK